MNLGTLKQLIIGGFQVFDQKATIPFGPLTLIFGPNSAGKSAVLDALQVLHRLLSLDDPSEMEHPLYGEAASRVIDRHWRRSGSLPSGRASRLNLGVSLSVDLGFPYATVNDPRFSHAERTAAAFCSLVRPHAEDGRSEVALELEYRCVQDPEAQRIPGNLTVNVSLGALGSRFLVIEDASVCVCLGHPLVSRVVDRALALDLVELASEHFSIAGDWFRIAPMVLEGTGASIWHAKETLERCIGTSSDKAQIGLHNIEAFINTCFSGAAAVVRSVLSLHVVPASRVVPPARSLTYLFDAGGVEDLDGERFGFTLESSPEFRDFAGDALSVTLRPWSTGERREFEANESVPPGLFRGAKLERLNRLLGEHLFRERGYFVSGEIHELRPIGTSRAVAESEGAPNASNAFLVSLLLVDAAGRRLKFEEVGSGLGYALPVLAAISRDRFSFIQQPELHLHPALQSELADAFIAGLTEGDASSGSPEAPRQYVIETHSEHLLLRLLRRIRQTAHGSLNPNTRHLDRDSLVVLYVDPQADGSSTVQRLRISLDGEFMDRWPRGFFEERWKDLFDE